MLHLKMPQTKITIFTNNLSRVAKRTMFTTRNVANKAVNMNLIRQTGTGFSTQSQVINPTMLKNIQRNNPGQGYRAGNYHEDVRTATGKELPQHEKAHVNIIDNETGKNVAVFSSCKKTNKGFEFISKQNINEDTLQNGKPKEQWAASLKTPRCHDENIFVEDEKATIFANQHKKNIDAMLNKSNTHTKVPIKRVHKDSSELYHENGQPIFDVYGNEIEYI